MNYLDGNTFKSLCYYQYEGNELKINKEGRQNFIFVKTDFIYQFFTSFNIDFNFTLITHNSDYDINSSHLPILNNKNLVKWYAQNVNYEHPKLHCIPIGLANDQWVHGNKIIFDKINKSNIKKIITCYANFDIITNPLERTYCLSHLPSEYVYSKTDFSSYLTQLKSSFFTVSPEGNGIDCHKTWEALYFKTIPVVKESTLTRNFKKKELPLILIKDWEEIRDIKFTPQLYNTLISNFNPNNLNINYFINE